MTSRTTSPVLLRERKIGIEKLFKCFIHHQVERDRKRGGGNFDKWILFLHRKGGGRGWTKTN